MRLLRSLSVLATLAGCSATPFGTLDTKPGFAPPVGEDVIEGSFLVYTRGWDAPEGVADRVGAYALDSARRFDAEDPDYDSIWRLRSTADWEAVYAAAIDAPDVVLVEPERMARKSSWTPDDPLFERQWNLAAIGMPEAWPLATGAEVIVAVLDTGVSEGPDGFTRLLSGVDFVEDDDDASDVDGHGTHVAGTVAQATDNGFGAAGVAIDASILPVRVLGDTGSGSMLDVADGILWAVDEGADVVNLSLGSGGATRAVQSAVTYAERRGVVVVGASGNDGRQRVEYPAAYRTVLAVGAVDARGRVSGYSNGGEALSLVAPGGSVNMDANRDGYVDGVLQEAFERGRFAFRYYEGTSMATPHVAGAVALLVELVGRDPELVRDLLQSTARDGGSAGRDDDYGWGRLDVAAAVEQARELVGPVRDDDPDDDPDDGPDDGPDDTSDDGPDDTPDDGPTGGLLGITELMPNPDDHIDDLGEYIEVWNDTDAPVALSDLQLFDLAGNGGAVTSERILSPGDIAVLGRVDADDWPWQAVDLDGTYPQALSLNNGGDTITLLWNDNTLDVVTYGRSSDGVSLERASEGMWANADTAIPGSTDLGSPGWLP